MDHAGLLGEASGSAALSDSSWLFTPCAPAQPARATVEGKCEKGLLQGLPENLTHPERLGSSLPPLDAHHIEMSVSS